MVRPRDRPLTLGLVVEGRPDLPHQGPADGRQHLQAASRLRRFFSAAVFSWPHAASMSRPRGVRTGADMPASNTILLKERMRSAVEHSYAAPGHGLNGIRLTFAGKRYLRISRTSSRACSSLSFLSLSITYSNVIRRALFAPG